MALNQRPAQHLRALPLWVDSYDNDEKLLGLSGAIGVRFMIRPRTVLAFLVFWLPPALAWSQTASGSQDFTFTIATSQSWTDTRLDLQAGDLLRISASSVPSSGCDPRGSSGAAQVAGLPLPSAPAGALIARLQDHGASALLVADGTELHIEVPSHLFLGVNAIGQPPCLGAFSVTVHRVAAGSVTAQEAGSKPRGEQLKSQLSAAAQIFVQGQLGEDKSSGSSAGTSGAVSGGANGTSAEASKPAPVLKLSDAPLDSELRKDIDGLPRRVNDQFQNLGDMVNFVIVGSQKNVQAALDAASWHVADTTKKKAMLAAALETYENKDYLQMPMSTLYLFGRPQDFGYEMAEPIAMVASRHHFRIWKAPITWKGEEIWAGAGTHDIGFAKDKRNGSVTHKIDPLVDGERDNIGGSLQQANKVKSLTYYLPSNPVLGAKNATGDGYQSDGRLLVIILQ
jgi:LssY-like putative type I secretion system component LssY